jgi:hypothetical protein
MKWENDIISSGRHLALESAFPFSPAILILRQGLLIRFSSPGKISRH